MVAKFKKKKKRSAWRKIFSSILFIVLSLVVIGFLINTNIKIKQRRAGLLARIESLKQEIQILEEKNKELKENISQAGTEEYLERIAREELGLKAPGEEVVVISEEIEEEGEAVKEKKTWWEWIKSIWKH